MTVATVPGFDAMHVNIGSLPYGQAAGYVTGSSWLAWAGADWEAHPGALQIDQDAAASVPTADYLDVESGAATPAEAPGWYRKAKAAYDQAIRPGQRHPGVYMDMSSVTTVVNALIAGGVTSCPLIVAEYGIAEAEAQAIVANPSGPFPVVGFQWRDAGLYDCNVFSVPWLEAVSGAAPVPPGPPAYGRPRNLRADGGHTTVGLSWDAPGTPGLPAPAEYLVYVYKGGECRRSTLVRSYPRTAASSPFEGGSLERGASYTAHVVASGPDGANVKRDVYATARFTTA